ncbi:peroxide stress protein YaaA [Kineosporia sp. J2-2]|uniref:Peroxide stress protein YaaA n=1 Tax=Kineosporia corallincola TaxID=2835133 RepID=A0ABS5TKR7_9ACTN|nr:peroxide stress protein YaaA [Kineosporia corallincola]MBT0770954.1 peroxide stress protein YaaA [Kineosporia corallincola]
MLVLLPPSESKAAPAKRGRAVALEDLSFPGLTDLRKQVLEALITTSARPDALELLGVGASLAGEVARNLTLHSAPARPAHEVYTGVLYDALDWPALSPAARRRGASRVVVISALWGALRPGDRVPSYRLSMDGELPALGPLARHWRTELPGVLTEAAGRRGVIVDCRSGPYVAAAPVTSFPTGLADRTVAVRVLRESAGKRSVVSHLAKHTRGEVTRYLLERGADPSSPAELRDLVGERWPAELTGPARAGAAWTLDVVLRA